MPPIWPLRSSLLQVLDTPLPSACQPSLEGRHIDYGQIRLITGFPQPQKRQQAGDPEKPGMDEQHQSNRVRYQLQQSPESVARQAFHATAQCLGDVVAVRKNDTSLDSRK